MFANKTIQGLNNICGKNIAIYRYSKKLSQRELANSLQLLGLDIRKNAIQRIECGKRFVTDFELLYFAKALDITICDLLESCHEK